MFFGLYLNFAGKMETHFWMALDFSFYIGLNNIAIDRRISKKMINSTRDPSVSSPEHNCAILLKKIK